MLILFSSPAYIFLIMSIVCIWFPVIHWGKLSIRLWHIFLILSLATALATDILGLLGLLVVLALYLLLLEAARTREQKVLYLLSLGGGLILVVALAMHKVPGFDNLLILNKVQISHDAPPFTLYANFDKGIAGLLLLGIFCRKASSWGQFKVDFQRSLPFVIATILLLIVAGLLSQFFRFDFKLPALTPAFIAINLLLTCVAEEAFFRGFVQEHLHRLNSNPFGSALAVGGSTLLFGLAHSAGGIGYVALASLAGLGYSLVYQQSRRIEMAILVHFGFNLIHLLCFTFPYYVKV